MKTKKPSKIELLQSCLTSTPAKEEYKYLVNGRVFFRGPAGYWVLPADQDVKNPFDEETAEYLGLTFDASIKTIKYMRFPVTNYDKYPLSN